MGTHVSFIFRGYNPYIGINVGNIYIYISPMDASWDSIKNQIGLYQTDL